MMKTTKTKLLNTGENITSISVLWGNRKESIAVLTDKMLQSLVFLRDNSENIFEDYCELAFSKKKANNKILLNETTIKEMILKHFDEDLGASVSLWNGKKEDELAANFSTRIGMSRGNEKLKNNFVINFPTQHQLSNEQIHNIIAKLYELWEAEQVRMNGLILENYE
ncbi:hypothetical protein [Neisseria montereyensis]|uniref:Uncharacterized protein n=1 Tax=Neisseria montereyensis TaxID=2973938 RepID=A0ABT2FCE7_9NEIS|nr:hypothetical protein [Neisseria montereyensis]MCS4533831.1 hypothetical protein [Neisseria montereyensis]